MVEIFASAQGEGPDVGAATTFVRFGGCDLRCAWCDSPTTWRPARNCRIEQGPGTGRFALCDNPVPMAQLAEAVEALAPPRERRLDHFVALTGGEPLLQADALRELARHVGARGSTRYLETHGLAVEALEKVIDEIDVVSMDWKLASAVSTAPGEPAVDFAARHRAFLALASAHARVHVKVVVTPGTQDAELDAVAAALGEVAPDVLLVLQPVTPFARVREAPTAEALLRWQRRLGDRGARVRVIPQTHKSYGAL